MTQREDGSVERDRGQPRGADAASSVSLSETHFAPFREGIVGRDAQIRTPDGIKDLVYLDWTASGRLFRPVEERLLEIGTVYGNSHSPDSYVGAVTTAAYLKAQQILKDHVHADAGDMILTCGSGMTGPTNKLQRILGMRGDFTDRNRPLVVVTHMEHHSNHTSWLHTGAEVVVLRPDARGLPDLNHLSDICESAANRTLYVSSTACSNVTGITLPVHEMAKIVHTHGGWFFADFAASAPYVDIDMHPEDPEEKLDAVFFSPHKYLGGPGSVGVVVFDRRLHHHGVPVDVGGGVVKWTNPWGQESFVDDLEAREDAGTPALLQTMKAALATGVKDQMTVLRIQERKKELLEAAFTGLRKIPGLSILAGEHEDRQGIISFSVDKLHYAYVVKLLNDRYGIQSRGGCSCAGTYGHLLFDIDRETSRKITEGIDRGDSSLKPGWVRISLHPTMTKRELEFVIHAIAEVVEKGESWLEDYHYSPDHNTWTHRRENGLPDVSAWFRQN